MSKGYRFGPFRLDATRRRLFRDGDSISVPPKALDVLEVLIENRGRTVDKEDLLARVWPDTVVEDANLTQSIFLLRRALGDDPADPRYISTVARRGYRFVGTASDEMTAAAPEDRSRVHRTANVNAYHAYLKGRHYWSKRDTDDCARPSHSSGKRLISTRRMQTPTSVSQSATSYGGSTVGRPRQMPSPPRKPQQPELSISTRPSRKLTPL